MFETSNPSDSLRCAVKPIHYTRELVNERLKELWAFKALAPLDVLALLCWRFVFEAVPLGTRPSKMVDEIGRAQARVVPFVASFVSPNRNFRPGRDGLVLPVTARFASSLSEWDEWVAGKRMPPEELPEPEREKLIEERRRHALSPRVQWIRELFFTWAIHRLSLKQVKAAMLRGAALAGLHPNRRGEEGETELFHAVHNELWLAGAHFRLLYRRKDGDYEIDHVAVKDELRGPEYRDKLWPVKAVSLDDPAAETGEDAASLGEMLSAHNTPTPDEGAAEREAVIEAKPAVEAVRATAKARRAMKTRPKAMRAVRKHIVGLFSGWISLRQVARDEKCDLGELSRAYASEREVYEGLPGVDHYRKAAGLE
ncbi:MAG: hypothetical protein HY716_17240 [Planctomycetes bacterium]|nr:hypothetical protein [Planctomycetota bacterium]